MKHKNGNTTHHLIPRSRGGANEDWNIREIPAHRHDAWHALFGNMLPEEIILALVDDWFPSHHFCRITCERANGTTYVVNPDTGA